MLKLIIAMLSIITSGYSMDKNEEEQKRCSSPNLAKINVPMSDEQIAEMKAKEDNKIDPRKLSKDVYASNRYLHTVPEVSDVLKEQIRGSGQYLTKCGQCISKEVLQCCHIDRDKLFKFETMLFEETSDYLVNGFPELKIINDGVIVGQIFRKIREAINTDLKSNTLEKGFSSHQNIRWGYGADIVLSAIRKCDTAVGLSEYFIIDDKYFDPDKNKPKEYYDYNDQQKLKYWLKVRRNKSS